MINWQQGQRPHFLQAHFIAIGILAVALILRLRGITFGLPALLDPDELMFELGAYKMIAGGRMNPEWFGHPATTTMYVLACVDALVFGWGWLVGTFSSPDEFASAIFMDPGLIVLPGRVAMVLFGIAGVYLTWRLGRDLAGPVAGIFAACFMALSPLHIGWSQVVRSDVMATVFLTATMIAALKLLREGKWANIGWGSLFAALAIASKWPFAVGVGSLLLAVGVRYLRHQATVQTTFLSAMCAVLLTVALLACISPYLIIDFQTVVGNLRGEAQVRHVGATGDGFVSNLWFYASGPLFFGLGPAPVLLSVVGAALPRTRIEFWAVAGAPALAMLALISSQNLVWDRWAIAILPSISIAAGIACAELLRRYKDVKSSSKWTLLASVGALLFVPQLWLGHRANSERVMDTRRLATDWVRANVPQGSKILVEHFAFDLLADDFGIIFPIGTGGCFDARELLAGRIDYKQIDSLRGGHSNLDFGAVPESVAETCKADFAILTEYARYAAERQAHPIEFARYAKLLSTAKVVARFRAVPGQIGGRPDVIVIKFPESQATLYRETVR